MSDDVETRLQQIRVKQQEASKKKAQAEARLDAATARRDEVLRQLKDLGFDSVAAARERANELEAETEQALASIEAKAKEL